MHVCYVHTYVCMLYIIKFKFHLFIYLFLSFIQQIMYLFCKYDKSVQLYIVSLKNTNPIIVHFFSSIIIFQNQYYTCIDQVYVHWNCNNVYLIVIEWIFKLETYVHYRILNFNEYT